jgi:biopolymer transport protein ExbD
MTTWKIRHLGSEQVYSDLTPEQIIEGVKEGIWDPSDEVQAASESRWTTMDLHPQFREALADIEVDEPLTHEEEARLDMNPLIDVALVLLIFFMLTTSYEEMRKELPTTPPNQKGQAASVTQEQLNQIVIRATVMMENGQIVFRLDDEPVEESRLQKKLTELIESTGRKKLAVEVGPNVPWKNFIALQDAATGAKIEETIRIIRKPSGT